MAERRIQRQTRNESSKFDSKAKEAASAKRRSRSEGPHGRRRARTSMHETSRSPQVPKHPSDSRHSMFTGHLSDDYDEKMYLAGSDSPETDDSGRKQWTKNPLVTKRSKRSDKGVKNENRKSLRGVENGVGNESPKIQKRSSREIKNVPNSKKKDLYMYNEKSESSPSSSQKAKFQKLEEMRKKRIDLAVTSDEECSPQLRISRLRQRAMMSSKIFNDNDNEREERLNIYPANYRSMSSNSINKEVPVNRRSNYDEPDVIIHTNGLINSDTWTNGVSNIPASKPPVRNVSAPAFVNASSSGGFRDGQLNTQRFVEGTHGGIRAYPNVPNPQTSRSAGLNITSESPPMRSFHEVKSNEPNQLKKAVEKIELNPRSPNSSSDDSLDELIDSNIQYLESEIESGKIKRKSGNYSNLPADIISRQSPVTAPKPTLSASEEIKARLKGPSNNSRRIATVTKFEPVPKFVHRSNSYSEENNLRNVHQGNGQNVVYLNPNATYSPYMHRKNHEYQDDMSKSDSQLYDMDNPYDVNQPFYKQGQQHVAPYPVLNQQTGNVIYVQPIVYNQPQPTSASSLSNSVEAGMFSDVDYEIEVSERIKKWEKKVKPGDKEERGSRSILNTIQEFEHFSDANQKENVETPLEIRRELRLLTEHPDTTGVGKLSVNLTGSTSTVSDAGEFYPHGHLNVSYNEPKVMSSETNLHRIFRVVQEPKQRNVRRAGEKVTMQTAQQRAMPVQVLTRPNEPQYAQSMSNVTFSETEMGTNAQQTWPPMAVDSDSGVRKSWRVSRYEDELNELKEIVSDNFRDLKKKFDSDASETDTKRDSSPVRTVPVQAKQTFEKGKPTSLKIESKTRSPAPPRRKHFEMKFATPPASPGVRRVAPRFESKREQMKNIPGVEDKPVPEVWSPQLESRKGLVSMERVKARTLQTIPLSEDPIWKEMEDLATFDRSRKAAQDIIKEINFDDIDALLELATKGTQSLERNNTEVAKAEKLMTSNFTPSQTEAKTKIPLIRPRIMSDPSVRKQDIKSNNYFPTPPIKPLKLRTEIAPRKSSASALDEVLEDIRNSLQKKPSDSNSSPNISIQSPPTKPAKFEFPKGEKPVNKVAMNTEELESTLATALHARQSTAPHQQQQLANVPYIDPEFTQYPYIINGNYHLDPSLLSEKLNRTGLVTERNSQRSSQPFHQTEPAVNKSVRPAPIPVVNKREHAPKSVAQPIRVEQQNAHAGVDDLDQSVVELKGLAKEVEQKLSQIKSKIVTADEDKLDSVLLALRKFAPMTEQKYFDVKFTPYETDKVKRNKLESALNELEKMYEILDLDDPSLMDRASRMEETSRTVRPNQQRYDPPVRKSAQHRTDNPVGTNYRKSQIEEVERQTQNEFEDITKSFQVLIDEVTRQCHVVAQGSRQYAPELVHVTEVHHSSQPQREAVCPPPPRRHIPVQTQRSVQDSYNNAIKELESVAKAPPKPVQSAVYVNLNSSVQTKPVETKRIDSAKNLNIQVQSKAVTTRESRSSLSDSNVKTVSSASQANQPVTISSKMNISPSVNSAALNQNQTEPKLRGGRFRRRTNPEHRKSMPALTRSVETQTAETQTEVASPVQDMNDILKLERQGSLQESSDNSGVRVVGTRKLSGGVAKIVEMFSSSEDEKSKPPSKLKHSYSAPDLTAVETFEQIKLNKLNLNVEKRKPSKPSTPRSVKQKREAKLRSRPTRDETNQDDMTSSVTSEDGVMSPTNKPPVYPNWRYPGVIEFQQSSSKKSEGRPTQVQETVRAVSDTEREPINRATDQPDIVRRRTRSASDQETNERPRSFHELMATFENDPKRLEKIRMSGLRKCASEDSIFTDLVLQKIYHSDTDLDKSEFGFLKSKSGSGLKLALEIQLKGDK